LRGFFFDFSDWDRGLTYDDPIRRFSWFRIVLVLLKLGWGTAAAMPLSASFGHAPTSALLPCHTNMANSAGTAPRQQPNPQEDPHHLDSRQTAQLVGETGPLPWPVSSHDTDCSDCQLCCAIRLDVSSWSLPQAVPASTPRGMTQRWKSVSLRPELRPPLL